MPGHWVCLGSRADFVWISLTRTLQTDPKNPQEPVHTGSDPLAIRGPLKTILEHMALHKCLLCLLPLCIVNTGSIHIQTVYPWLT